MRFFLLSQLQWAISLLQIQSTAPPFWKKALHSLLVTPVFLFGLLFLFLSYLFRWPFDCVSETRFGFRFGMRQIDAVELYVYLFGVWEPDISHYINKGLSAGDVFIDVGAHVGWHTHLAAKCIDPSGKVIAIEASPAIGQRLQKNLDLNCFKDRVKVLSGAVTDHEKSIDVIAGKRFNSGWTSTRAEAQGPLEAVVEGRPLKNWLERSLTQDEMARLRLVKIDVEGDELAVIEGLRPLLDGAYEATEFLIELSPRWWPKKEMTLQEALTPFLDRGYRAYQIENSYNPFRYLWPNALSPHRESEFKLCWGQMDVLLSRRKPV